MTRTGATSLSRSARRSPCKRGIRQSLGRGVKPKGLEEQNSRGVGGCLPLARRIHVTRKDSNEVGQASKRASVCIAHERNSKTKAPRGGSESNRDCAKPWHGTPDVATSFMPAYPPPQYSAASLFTRTA